LLAIRKLSRNELGEIDANLLEEDLGPASLTFVPELDFRVARYPLAMGGECYDVLGRV
jgi:hypothetical protein